jgi:hypothetical protein
VGDWEEREERECVFASGRVTPANATGGRQANHKPGPTLPVKRAGQNSATGRITPHYHRYSTVHHSHSPLAVGTAQRHYLGNWNSCRPRVIRGYAFYDFKKHRNYARYHVTVSTVLLALLPKPAAAAI